MSKDKRNRTGEVEARIKALFLIIRILINDLVRSTGITRPIAEDSNDPHGVVFHFGNRSNLLDSKNVKQGKGYTLIWPDAKGINTKRLGATCFLSTAMGDDVTALQSVIPAMRDILTRVNKGHDNLPALIDEVFSEVGMTATGKLSKALQDRLAPALKELGAWPVPSLSKATVTRNKQGQKGPVKAFCTGDLNGVDDKGKPIQCTVESERHKPVVYWRAFMPQTFEEEIPDASCKFCGGPLATHADIQEMRKASIVVEEIEV